MNELALTMVFPGGLPQFGEKITSATVPCLFGYAQVLPGHAPMTALVCRGIIEIVSPGGTAYYRTDQGGFLRVEGDDTILVLKDCVQVPAADSVVSDQFFHRLDEIRKRFNAGVTPADSRSTLASD